MENERDRVVPLLRMAGITKRFPGVLALAGIDLTLRAGEILGLVGENGAGKSTLMAILAGIHTPEEGKVYVRGQAVRLGSVRESLAHGVSIIHQELNLAGNLDVASNIFLGREPSGRLGKVDRKALYRDAARWAQLVGLTVPLETIVEDLPQAQRQLVEIARALSLSATILVLDEPTSSLSPKEADFLFSVMSTLKSKGVSMIYISHRLHEVEQMCDRVVVMRDGRLAGELEGAAIKRDEMVRLMVGRDISRYFAENAVLPSTRPVMSVRGLRCRGCRGEFSFDVLAGEILGIAGLVGAGRTDLLRSLFGVSPPLSGRILMDGNEVKIRSPRDAIRCGLALVPEDRKELGVLLDMSIRENVSLPSYAVSTKALLDLKRETDLATEQVAALSIKTPSLEQTADCLSGGNQQKVVLGKWLALRPKVLFLDEPTRGIDVGSKSEIYSLVRSLAESGVAIVMVSSDMEEIVGLCDRVMVMHEGSLQGVLGRSAISEERIMQFATGSTQQ